MNRNRKSCLLLLIILGSPILLFFLYLFISSFLSRTKTYYVSDVNMYIKTIWKPYDKYGYILLGNNPDITLSDKIDYIKVYPKISNGIFLKQNNDTVWVNNPIQLSVYYGNNGLEYKYIEANKPKKVNCQKYIIIDKVNKTEPILLNKKDIKDLLLIKEPYIEISVGDYFNSLWIKNTGDSVYTKIEPIK